MPVETRWMRNETHTINLLLAWKLHLAKITVATSCSRTVPMYSDACPVGIRVWERTAGGVENEITAGVPVAQVLFLTGDVSVTRSNTWTCPATVIACTSSVVVRIYCFLAGSWALIFGCAPQTILSTEVLNGNLLNNVIWTVYYTGSFSAVMFPTIKSMFTLWWDGAHNTRITNFSWNPCPVVALKLMVGDGLTWAVMNKG